MTELAYMIREDWAQGGTSMVPQSAVIREWLGEPPYLFAVSDLKRLREPNSADTEFISYVAVEKGSQRIVGISELRNFAQDNNRFAGTLTVLHPHGKDDFELLREVVATNRIERLCRCLVSLKDGPDVA